MEPENTSVDSIRSLRVFKSANNSYLSSTATKSPSSSWLDKAAAKMGVSERSKTFTIENILKDESKSSVAQMPSAELMARLDFAAKATPSHLLFPNWMRMQPNPPQAHYLLGGLPGNKAVQGGGGASSTTKRSRKQPGIDRKPRQAYSSKQLEKLETEFKHDKYLSVNKRIELSKLLNLTEIQIKTWFQNRRTKWKKQLTSRLKIAQRQGMYANAYLSTMFHAPSILQPHPVIANAGISYPLLHPEQSQLGYLLNNDHFLRSIVSSSNHQLIQFSGNPHHRSSTSPASTISSEVSINLTNS